MRLSSRRHNFVNFRDISLKLDPFVLYYDVLKLVNMCYSLSWSNSVVTSPSGSVGELTIIPVHLSTTNRRSGGRVFACWVMAGMYGAHITKVYQEIVPI